MQWKTLKTDVVYDSKYVSVLKNKVQLPDGAIIEDFHTVRIQDAALIVALTPENDILLKKEFRYACCEEVIECPAGMFEEGEAPLDVAKRELLEETGDTSDDWTYWGYTWESTSKLTNKMHLFLAKNCIKVSEQHLDPNEHVEVIKVSLDEAVKMVMDGRINANSTAHAVLRANIIMRKA